MKRILLAAVSAVMITACTTTDPYTGERTQNRAATGAIIGAIGGAAAGTAAGGNDRRNAIIGAGIGAIAGAAAGGYMDAQERKLREQLGSSGVGVTRTAQNEILLNVPADVTFDFNKADVKPEFRDSLYKLAQTLREYEATTIDVVGHADSVGDDSYNQALSERRAASVAQVLISNGVQPVRVVTTGLGERSPVASNETPDGRARNRRVDIKLQTVTS